MSKSDEIRPTAGGELSVVVFAPRKPEPAKFQWAKSLSVGEAADQAARFFGYEAGKPTLQYKEGRVLLRDKTLLDAGVQDLDELELTDTGGGV